MNLHALCNVDVASVAMLLSHYFPLFLFFFSVLFLVFGGAMFLGSLSILVVKFPRLVGFYREIRLIFLSFFRVFHESSYG